MIVEIAQTKREIVFGSCARHFQIIVKTIITLFLNNKFKDTKKLNFQFYLYSVVLLLTLY